MTTGSASNTVRVRPSTPGDHAKIEALYPRAFPGEDLLPLVSDLLQNKQDVTSLVADREGQVVGHVLFTRCTTEKGDDVVALLAPLAVAPECQRLGIGSALIREGLERLRDAGVAFVYVLGDPAYYGRLGFTPERLVQPPYPLPPEWADAWQSLQLDTSIPRPSGRLLPPERWLDPALWSE